MSQRDGTRARAQQVDDVELPAAGIWLVWELVCCVLECCWVELEPAWSWLLLGWSWARRGVYSHLVTAGR